MARNYGMIPKELVYGAGSRIVNADGTARRGMSGLGVGKPIEGGMTVDQVLAATGTDWEVELVNVQAGGREIPGVRAVVKKGTGEIVSGKRTVTAGFTPFQNRARADFAQVLVEAAGGELRFEAGGVMGDGQIVWYQARVPHSAVIRETALGEDRVEPFLFLLGAHDGTMSETAAFTANRIWCNNQVAHTVSGAKTKTRVRHTRSLHERMKMAQQVIRDALGFFEEHVADMKALDAQQMKLNEMRAFAEKLIGETQESIAEADRTIGSGVAERRIAQRDRLVDLFGSGLGNVGRSRLDALNAVTEFVDHHRARMSPDSRIRQLALAPAGEDLKARALKLLA